MQETSLLMSGKYEFYITGVITSDREGNLLKMRDGNSYKKLKLAVINRQGYTHHVYDPVFGEDYEKLEQIIKSIGSEVLFRRLRTHRLELKDLIGTGGYCIIGVREGREGYNDQNSVECYLQKDYGALFDDSARPVEPKNVQPSAVAPPTETPSPEKAMTIAEEELNDDIPF